MARWTEDVFGGGTAALMSRLDAVGGVFDSAVPDQRRAPMSDLSLEEQVRRAFEEWRDPVYRYLLASGGRPPEAEDLTQEAFLRLHRHLQGGHRIQNVRGWVFRVAHNLWIDAARAAGHVIHASPAQWEAWQRLRPDQGPDPELLLLQRERMDLLEDALTSLTDKQRQSLFLRAEGLSYREIAEVLGVSVWTAVDAVQRAVEKLGKVSHA